MTVVSLGSLTRISDLDRKPYEVARIPKEHWDTGDYVVGEISSTSRQNYLIELASGRTINAMPGSHFVGAFGNRAATLEGVGSWSDIRDGRMNAMTSAGLFGAITSLSAMIPRTVELDYLGHAVRDGTKICMSDFAIGPTTGEFNVPTVLLVGTSMSAGKTTTGRLVVHELEKMGKNVIGTKLTGAGRYRDVLSFRDAGASAIFDFVDAGLPSTVVSEAVFRDAIRPLLQKIASLEPDVVVAEAGASPLEPYNGSAAIEELGDNICCTILCASDPYAVVGVEKAFGLKPDLVSGPATSTSAAIDLVHKLAGVEAINIMDRDSLPALRRILKQTLKL
jgi:hypothetical protein